MDFNNKVVVITGASSGIGKELAFQCAKKGAKVVLAARNKRALEDNVRQINGAGGTARAVPTDVSIRSQVENLVLKSIQEFGRIDIFVSNAGVTHASADLVDLSEEDFRRVMEVNLMGAAFAVWAVAPQMEKTGGGQLVFISSVVGKRGIYENSGYCASKFALQGLTESIRPELKKKKIHVLTVCPPGVDTPFFENNNRGVVRRFRLHPVKEITRDIVCAIEKEKREIWPTLGGKALVVANMIFPGFLDWAISFFKGEKT